MEKSTAQNTPGTPIAINSLAEELYVKNLELLEQRRRTEQLLYSVSEAVFAIDDTFKITIFNKTAETIIGKKADQVIGEDVDGTVWLETEDGKRITSREYCYQDSEILVLNQVVLRGKERIYYVNVKSRVIKHANSKTECIVTLTDITNERELDKSKDDFISVASHELRTPMTIIKSYLWMLQNNKAGELNIKQLEYLLKAVAGTERMIKLINDMLNISRMDQGKTTFNIKKLKLGDLIRDAVSGFDLKAMEKGIELKVEQFDNSLEIYTDDLKFREILINLLGNSLKFTKQGGIAVSVTNNPQEDFVKVLVSDTGAGISAEDLKRLFYKFGRLDNSYTTVAESGGSGLGLYIVKMYVDAMGGEVHAYSAGIKKGSTFWFTVPKFHVDVKPAPLENVKVLG